MVHQRMMCGIIGPNDELMKALSVKTVSHPHPDIVLDSVIEDHISITLAIPHTIEFAFDLRYDGDTSGRRLINDRAYDLVKVKSTNTSITFRVQLKTPGRFLFSIYAKPKSPDQKQDDSLQHLYTYAITRPTT
ncbi:hypothetical protein ACOME3_007857 [Neoechinorhynchus agilis]